MRDRRFPSRLRAIALQVASAIVAGGCSEPPAPPWPGWVVGDHVHVASPLGGRLDELAVRAGDTVVRGQPLFALESDSERAARDEAAARLAAADAQLADLRKGRRADEIAVIEAQRAQARADAELAASEVERQRQLFERGFVSRARLDDATAALEHVRARVAELDASLRVARLPARADTREAARAASAAAGDVLRQGEWRAGQKRQAAPADATVAEVFYRVGEFVPAGQPVLSLLPPGNVKARFFVPQAALPGLRTGGAVTVTCDGCGAPIAARISRIATRAEYTPPLVYSDSQRAKLVFMVEAVAEAADATRLRAGQPIEVRVAAEAAAR